MIDRYFKRMEGSDDSQTSLLQTLWRGFGIMVDDLAAAFFTLLAIALIQKMISI
jgi:phosphatidylglycerophosphatase A